jgi:hypothetical protein
VEVGTFLQDCHLVILQRILHQVIIFSIVPFSSIYLLNDIFVFEMFLYNIRKSCIKVTCQKDSLGPIEDLRGKGLLHEMFVKLIELFQTKELVVETTLKTSIDETKY